MNCCANLMMDSNGNFAFAASGVNKHLVQNVMVYFRGGFDGHEYFNMGVSADHFQGTFVNSYGFQRNIFKDNYLDFIRKPLALTVSVE